MTPDSRQSRRVGSAQKKGIQERDSTKERNVGMTMLYPVEVEIASVPKTKTKTKFCEVKTTNTQISLEQTKRSLGNYIDHYAFRVYTDFIFLIPF